MKTVLASEAMELCAKAMEAAMVPRARRGLPIPDEDDVRAIYVAAATIQAAWITKPVNYSPMESPEMTIPDWLAQVGAP